jgi:hypothetical protein
MPEMAVVAGGTSREQELRRISQALHELCQPLTTLQCRLEMAELVDTPEACREAVVAGLVECGRMSAAVGTMRQAVRTPIQQTVVEMDIEIGRSR